MEKSWFVLSGKLSKINRHSSHIRFSDSFAKKMILSFTKKGDRILDPFAGYGTTLLIAQSLHRVGYGIEYDKQRCAFIQRKVHSPSVIIHGNSSKLSSYSLPKFDFCLTSPPYMRSFDKENPFTNFSTQGTYQQYLQDIYKIYKQIQKVMKPNARIVVEVANTFGKGHPMTSLAWDVGKELSKIFFLENELIYCVKDQPVDDGTFHSHVLLFRNKK